MKINDDIVKQYLAKGDPGEYNHSWVYHKIEEGQYLFAEPPYSEAELVREVHGKMLTLLGEFQPFNKGLFRRLFPKYEEILARTRVMLIVGAPDPYDAMVIRHQDEDYVVYDLLRLAGYVKYGHDITAVIRQLLTHEFVHRCLHEQYPPDQGISYLDKLNYMTFDEGFAHLLSYKDRIETYDFSTNEYQKRFAHAKAELKRALKEENPRAQREWLIAADSGRYWDKFGSISGKLYLAEKIDKLVEVYNGGWGSFVSFILKDQL